VRLRDAMRDAGLPATMDAIRALQRDPARYLGLSKCTSNRARCSTSWICHWAW